MIDCLNPVLFRKIPGGESIAPFLSHYDGSAFELTLLVLGGELSAPRCAKNLLAHVTEIRYFSRIRDARAPVTSGQYRAAVRFLAFTWQNFCADKSNVLKSIRESFNSGSVVPFFFLLPTDIKRTQ
jgi:hypothetical protein